MLFESGLINDQDLAKLTKDAKELRKPSLSFAFAMDKCKEERVRGVSLHWKTREFVTKSYNYTMIDAPVHRNYIKNMIHAASLSEVCSISCTSQ